MPFIPGNEEAESRNKANQGLTTQRLTPWTLEPAGSCFSCDPYFSFDLGPSISTPGASAPSPVKQGNKNNNFPMS